MGLDRAGHLWYNTCSMLQIMKGDDEHDVQEVRVPEADDRGAAFGMSGLWVLSAVGDAGAGEAV